ncbi:MAG: MFS transporter [Oscillospiraceae bacterium]|nr:MFS transporter [Oscillospiraceae bacterium]
MPHPETATGKDSPPGKNKWMILCITCVGTLMGAINNSSINLANPTLAVVFAVDVHQIQWVVTIYLLIICSVMLLFGRIGDRIGSHRVYLCGFAVFSAGSLFCGLSGSLALLLTGRAVQAFGAAMIFATGMGLVAGAFPVSQRGQALGYNTVAVGLGSMCGPSIGGFILSRFSWHYIFFINIPVGVIGFLLGLKFLRLPVPVNTKNLPRPDGKGALLFAVIIISLISAISGSFTGSVWLLLPAAALIFVFFRRERRHPSPLLDFDLLKNKRFAIGSLIAFFSYFTHFGVYFLMPFFMTEILRLSTAAAALALMVSPVCMAVTSPIFGTVSDRTGALRVMPYAFLVILAAQIIFGFLKPGSSPFLAACGLALLGSGLGMLNAPNNSEIMTAAGPDYAGYAGGFISTTRYLANCFGTAAAAGAFTGFRNLLERSREATDAFAGAFHRIIIAAALIVCANLIVCLWLRFSEKDRKA